MDKKTKDRIFILVCGIVGMFLVPLIVLEGLNLINGKISLENFITVSRGVFNIGGFFIFFPLYLNGFFIGVLIGYIIKEGLGTIFTVRLWLFGATCGALYGSVSAFMYINSLRLSGNKYAGLISYTHWVGNTFLWAIIGALLGWLLYNGYMKLKGKR